MDIFPHFLFIKKNKNLYIYIYIFRMGCPLRGNDIVQLWWPNLVRPGCGFFENLIFLVKDQHRITFSFDVTLSYIQCGMTSHQVSFRTYKTVSFAKIWATRLHSHLTWPICQQENTVSTPRISSTSCPNLFQTHPEDFTALTTCKAPPSRKTCCKPTLKQKSAAKRALIASVTIGYVVISFVKLRAAITLPLLSWTMIYLHQSIIWVNQ